LKISEEKLHLSVVLYEFTRKGIVVGTAIKNIQNVYQDHTLIQQFEMLKNGLRKTW